MRCSGRPVNLILEGWVKGDLEGEYGEAGSVPTAVLPF